MSLLREGNLWLALAFEAHADRVVARAWLDSLTDDDNGLFVPQTNG